VSYAVALTGLTAAVLDTFGTAEVDLDGSRFAAVFDQATQVFDAAGDPLYSGPVPVLHCRQGDVVGLVQGAALTIDGAPYRVRDVQPDDGGMVRVTLRTGAA
jgi:hypothetical protein